jgi:diguanylate cyclase (GGDEF)-like protein
MPENTISVLVIEDDAGLLRSIVDYLEDSGFDVKGLSSGQEGLDIYRRSKPDIVFTDLNMAGVNGLELIPQLRDEDPMIPIVVISSSNVISDAVESMKRGAWDFITKPVKRLAVIEDVARRMIAKAQDLKSQHPSDVQRVTAINFKQMHDSLTGLPNRVQLDALFRQRIKSGQQPCLVLIDLNEFKVINANFGHLITKDLLRQVAFRIDAQRKDGDVLAHLGGDEFAILTQNCDHAMKNLLAALETVFTEPFKAAGEDLFVSASIGVANWHGDDPAMDELLKCATISAYLAKKQGRTTVQYYDPSFGDRVRDRIELETSLRRALEREEFILYYQPQIDIADGTISGVEALIRWKRPDGTLVPPSDFIPVLEESGLIIPVGDWILKQACQQFVAWQSQGIAPLSISINISAPQFKSGRLPASVIRILHETGMSPAYLCLELTESIVMDDIEETITTLSTLRNMGISLSIDDFGTGYSSLSYLQKMPITELKIDKSFIMNIPEDSNNAVIVSSIISIANCMNIRVVAEGVETLEQLQHLMEQKCQTVQGYFFSKPLCAEGLQEFNQVFDEPHLFPKTGKNRLKLVQSIRHC